MNIANQLEIPIAKSILISNESIEYRGQPQFDLIFLNYRLTKQRQTQHFQSNWPHNFNEKVSI